MGSREFMLLFGLFVVAVAAGCLYARLTAASRLNRVVAVVIAAIIPSVIISVMAMFSDNTSGVLGSTPLQRIGGAFSYVGGVVLIVAVLAASVTAAVVHFAKLGRKNGPPA